MKRRSAVVLGAILSLAVTSTAQAQVAVGLRAGYNSAKLYVVEDEVDVSDISARSGFHAGADLAFGFSPMFGIQIGGAYSQKGAKLTGFGEDVTFKSDVIDVPALLVVSIPTGGNITPRLFAGGVASFEMSCKLTATSQSEDCDADNIGERKKSYFSLMAGVGVGIAAGPGSILLDVGYQYGLTNLSEDQGVNVRQDVIQASLGFRFPLGS